MAKTVNEIKAQFPDVKIIVGGAPLSQKAADEMGADAYSSGPQGAVEFLSKIANAG
jgi:5-methyltetrahydrofolate--homocysteine methyltransferase